MILFRLVALTLISSVVGFGCSHADAQTYPSRPITIASPSRYAATLEKRGAIFINEVEEAPEGAHLVFSAHGVSPAVVAAAAAAAEATRAEQQRLLDASTTEQQPAPAIAATTTTPATNAGYMGLPQNAQSTPYTLTIADQGRHIYLTGTGNVTIPSNVSVPFPIGAAITVINATGGNTNVGIASDTMYLAGSGTTGTRVLNNYAMATVLKVASTTWFINGSGVN